MQMSLVLILARDLADKLASAVFVVDHEGSLVYFNETAEKILGQSFSDVGQLRMEQWSTAFDAVDADGRRLSPEDLPLVLAIRDLKTSHRTFRIKGMDGALRDIAVTAMPLFAQPEELVGAMALFWEHAPASDPASDEATQ